MPPLWPLVFGNVLLRYEANSGPQRNLHNSAVWIHIKLCECEHDLMRHFMYRLQWEWKEHVGIKIMSDFLLSILNHLLDPGPSMGEMKVPRNMIHRSQHSPYEAAYSEKKNSGEGSKHCKEKGYGAKSHFFILQILPCLEPGAYEFCAPDNSGIKGTSFQISCCQNLNCPSQQPTFLKVIFLCTNRASQAFWPGGKISKTVVGPGTIWDWESLVLPEMTNAQIIVAVLVSSVYSVPSVYTNNWCFPGFKPMWKRKDWLSVWMS